MSADGQGLGGDAEKHGSDGSKGVEDSRCDVDALESKIFQTMLTGYGHDSTSFKPYYQSIKVKNIKTFSASVLKPKLIYSNVASGHESDEKGVRFNRDNSFQEDAADAGDKLGTAAPKDHRLPIERKAEA